MVSVVVSSIPVWAVFLPFFGAFAVFLAGRRSAQLRNAVAVAISALTFLLVVSMYPRVIGSGTPLEYHINLFIASGLNFRVDGTSLLLAILTSFIWMLATIYSLSYMEGEHAQNRFYTFLIFTLAADLGVLLTGDLFSLFIFFELLSLSSWVLVIHEETPEAMAAGKKYLFLGIIGGLSLLFGIVLMYIYAGTLDIAPLAGALDGLGSLRYVIAVAMTLGFGVKAGMFPVHVWLPDAHPVAPTPASALLSGVMIKAGAYGIIRTLNMIFTPSRETVSRFGEQGSAWLTTTNLGYVMIWIGIVTMFFAVCMALQQENSKRMLAYHSISQMGYILMGIGIAAYMGFEGAMGFGGALYHIVNHALFKALLFFTVGAVYYRTHELNMYKLGGLAMDMPFTFVAMVIASAGIAGVPLFNGYASKTMLHEAIVEASEMSDIVIPILKIKSLHLAEIIFAVTGGGTAASFMKLTTFTFLGKKDEERFGSVKSAPLPMKIAMGALASVIVFIGLKPNLLVNRFLIPSTSTFTYGTHVVGEQLGAFNVWTNHALLGIGVSLLIGALAYGYGIRTGIFHIDLPDWFGINFYYRAVANGFLRLARGPFSSFDRSINRGYVGSGGVALRFARAAEVFDGRIDTTYEGTGEKFLDVTGPALELDRRMDQAYIDSGDRFMRTSGPHQKKISRAPKRQLSYLMEPVTIFDQSAEEFFGGLAIGVIDVVKYPYALITSFFDSFMGRNEARNIESRAADFKAKMEELVEETPNISGISVAIFIIVGMLAIYLFTAIMA